MLDFYLSFDKILLLLLVLPYFGVTWEVSSSSFSQSGPLSPGQNKHDLSLYAVTASGHTCLLTSTCVPAWLQLCSYTCRPLWL